MTNENQSIVTWKNRMVHDLVTDKILPFEDYCISKKLFVRKGNAWHIDHEQEVEFKGQKLNARWLNKNEVVQETVRRRSTRVSSPKQNEEIDYVEFYKNILSGIRKDYSRLFQEGFTQAILYLQGEKNLQIISVRGNAGDKYFKQIDAYPKIKMVPEDQIENFKIAANEVFADCQLTIG